MPWVGSPLLHQRRGTLFETCCLRSETGRASFLQLLGLNSTTSSVHLICQRWTVAVGHIGKVHRSRKRHEGVAAVCSIVQGTSTGITVTAFASTGIQYHLVRVRRPSVHSLTTAVEVDCAGWDFCKVFLGTFCNPPLTVRPTKKYETHIVVEKPIHRQQSSCGVVVRERCSDRLQQP